MKNKSAGKTKRLLGYTLAIILIAAAFVSANVRGFTPKKAEAAYTPPLPLGGTAYTTSTTANQTGMVYLTDYTSYSGLQGGAIRVFNQNDGQSAPLAFEGGRKTTDIG